MSKNGSKTNENNTNDSLHIQYASDFMSEALSRYYTSSSKYFWRGKRLFKIGKRENDISAFPIWQIILEILNLLEQKEEYKIGIVKGNEFLFNKINYKGTVIYENKNIGVREDTLPDFLASVLLKLLNEK